ncbi:MAG: RluA family pseudouridine synthase [Kofleriaceae bacterium]|nr:RluA family pseudouridine synthase [Kofleriaceae bacterium]
MNSTVFLVGPGEDGRVDLVVANQYPDASRKRIAKLFSDGAVRVDGKRVKKGAWVEEGQQIKLKSAPAENEDFRVVPESGDLEQIYKDEHIVVLNKPANMASYPLVAGELGTLANVLVSHFPECIGVGDDPREAGLAHRLDRNTSGLLIAARTAESWSALRAQFSAGKVEKHYLAVVHRRPVSQECEEPLLQRGKRVVIDYAGLEAHTSWTELARADDFTLLRCQAHTGRMHQIRAHLAACDSPIAGDTLYKGSEQEGLAGHFLHAEKISFVHPVSGEKLSFEAPLPDVRIAWLAKQGLAL